MNIHTHNRNHLTELENPLPFSTMINPIVFITMLISIESHLPFLTEPRNFTELCCQLLCCLYVFCSMWWWWIIMMIIIVLDNNNIRFEVKFKYSNEYVSRKFMKSSKVRLCPLGNEKSNKKQNTEKNEEKRGNSIIDTSVTVYAYSLSYGWLNKCSIHEFNVILCAHHARAFAC